MNLLTGAVEVELDGGLKVVDDDIVLFDGKLNRGVELLRIELDVDDLLDEEKVEEGNRDLLDEDIEEELMADLLEVNVDDVLLRELELVKDFAVLEAHAFVLGVYSGPSGGYALIDAVSEVVVFVLLLDFLVELLVNIIEVLLKLVPDSLPEDVDEDTLDVLLELVLGSLLEDEGEDTLDILFVGLLESLLDDLSVELASVVLSTSASPAVELGNSDIVLLGLLLEN